MTRATLFACSDLSLVLVGTSGGEYSGKPPTRPPDAEQATLENSR